MKQRTVDRGQYLPKPQDTEHDMLIKRGAPYLFGSLAILLFPNLALGIMVGLSTEFLTKGADRVLTGIVEDVYSQWTEDGGSIISRCAVGIDAAIKGSLTDPFVTVEYPGGEVGATGLRVSDVAPLHTKERVLLFLRRTQQDRGAPVYRVFGNAQGKYTIDEQGLARKRGYTLAGESHVVDNDLPLSALIEKIQSFVDER